MKNYLVYNDAGASKECVVSTLSSLQAEKRERVRCIDSNELINSTGWMSEAAALIFPGGRDIPYHNALKGTGNKKIAAYVAQGGVYFGICAGGYYGSSFVDFERGGPLEVQEARELRFFPGIAQGPAYGIGRFNYGTEAGARVARLELSPSHFKVVSAYSYFNGGCLFVDADTYPSVTVIARYRDIKGKPAAIISCRIDKGRAILSGVHPEWPARQREASSSALNDTLREHDGKRREVFRGIINIIESQGIKRRRRHGDSAAP